MGFRKESLSLKQRINHLKNGILVLSQIYIKCYSEDTKEWSLKRFSFQDRFECFAAELKTFILDYVYGAK